MTENFAYLPFGGGRRKCIGDQFALFESIVGLSMLMRRYEFKLAPGAEVGMTTGAAWAGRGEGEKGRGRGEEEGERRRGRGEGEGEEGHDDVCREGGKER